MRSVVIFFTTVLFISGCATPIPLSIGGDYTQTDFDGMYLRGIMNWWEASEPYKLVQSETDKDVYTLQIELIADGQPYDFKIADGAWKNELNCGTGFGEQSIKLKQKKKLYCAGDSANLKFTPAQTGQYQFTLDVSSNRSPTIKISKVD